LGKEVLQQTHLLTVGKNNLVVATDQLQRGVHFVRVSQGAISISDKLVIE
jgi:superfamily II DNA/RNA helicase